VFCMFVCVHVQYVLYTYKFVFVCLVHMHIHTHITWYVNIQFTIVQYIDDMIKAIVNKVS